MSTELGTDSGPAVPACFEGLLDDAAALHGVGVGAALAAHRVHRAAWYGDLLGSFVLPATAVEELRAATTPADLGLPVVLVADVADPRDSLTVLREARNALVDDDRVLLAGVRLGIPALGADGLADLGPVAEALLAALDFSVPAWVELPVAGAWAGAQDVLAADGAEGLALALAGSQPERAGAQPDLAAAFLRHAVDLELTTRVLLGPGQLGAGQLGAELSLGVLRVLCTVRAALDGAGPEQLATLLACAAPEPLAAAVRAMGEADAVATRELLATVESGSVAAVVDGLDRLGLLDRG